MLLYYKDPSLLKKASQWLIQSEQARRQGAPQAGIVILHCFSPGTTGRDTPSYSRFVHSFVEIVCSPSLTPAINPTLRRALAERLQWLDCQGNSTIPYPHPAPGAADPTASCPSQSPGVYQVSACRSGGATNIRAYASRSTHGWLL